MHQCMLPWKKMNVVVNHVYHIHQSRCSRTSHNPSMHHKSYWGRGFLTCVFYERPTSSQGTAVDRGVYCASNQVCQRFCHTVFPKRERQLLIFTHPHVVVTSFIFEDTCDNIKIFFCYCDFLIRVCRMYILLVINKCSSCSWVIRFRTLVDARCSTCKLGVQTFQTRMFDVFKFRFEIFLMVGRILLVTSKNYTLNFRFETLTLKCAPVNIPP
jgi:hypothetical protein